MRHIAVITALLLTKVCIGQIALQGTIIDENAQPMPFVNIVVSTALDSTLVKGLVTDETGRFYEEIKDGDYHMEISFLGYGNISYEISQSRDFGTIQMTPDSQSLEEVTVTGQKPFIQKERDKLVVNVAGSIVNTGNSTMEILERSPGIVVDQDDNISLNGRNGVRIYIDNRDTRLQGQDLANLLRTLPATNIEKIEIITNPSARYEAQGNAGIINIVTKKGKLFGTNGSLTLTPGHGQYFRWENSINFNHRTESFNIYGQYSLAKRSQWMQIDIDRRFVDENDNTIASYRINNLFELPIETHTPRIGVDFQPGKNTTMGVLVTAFRNSNGSLATNNINQFDPNGDLGEIQNTVTDVDSRWNQLTGNFNFNHKFSKSTLDFNFDIARYDNSSDQSYDSEFLNGDNIPINENLLTGNVDGFLDLTGLSLDYEVKVNENDRFETGWKNTWVTADNDLRYFDTSNGITTPNDLLTNRFIYDEEIYGAYINYNLDRKKWNAQFGLRAEYTFIDGNQVTTNTSFENDYFELFPSASVNFNLNEKNTVGIAMSRRIDRPSYNQLNPFRFFVDTNTFRVGNPLLNPQFTWSGEVNYTLNGRYFFSFSYGYTTDNLNFGIIQDGDNQIVLVQPLNIDLLESYAFTASLPVKISKWWQSNWNLNASYNQFDGLVNGSQLNRSTPVVTLTSNHSFDLGNEFRVQLNTFNLFPHYASITRIEEISSVSVGVQKTVMDGKGTIRLNANDIFFNQYPVGVTDFAGIDDSFRSYRDSRYVTLSYTWRFGKQSVRPANRRNSGIQNELNRARQQNNG